MIVECHYCKKEFELGVRLSGNKGYVERGNFCCSDPLCKRKRLNFWQRNSHQFVKTRSFQNLPEDEEKIHSVAFVKKLGTCNIIKHHASTMKEDSERLSTEFIQTLLGRKCKT
jgi:hypothetical protein